MKRRMHGQQQGFTLFELVMVMIIIGVLTAVAMPRWSLRDASVHAQAAEIARDIRHVQMLAMTQGRTLTFQSQSTSYRCLDSGSAVITDPANQQSFNYPLKNGITLSAGSVSFDSLGRPVSGGNPVSIAANFSISGSSQTATLNVIPVTGFVTVNP